jgi:hypothetical protein
MKHNPSSKKITFASTLTLSLTLTLTFLGCNLFAQDISQWAEFQKTTLYEKVYLHIDREFYSPGDTLWFKSYLVGGLDNKLEPGYKNIYVQLVSPTGKVISNRLLLSIKGEAFGDIALDDSLADGQYTIRARTKYLENFGEESYFHKKIWVSKPQTPKEAFLPPPVDSPKIDALFFPAGGNLVLNAANLVAFKVVGQDGKGIEATGKIINERGGTITSFKTSFLGMGRFIFMPEEGKNYYATIDGYPNFNYKFGNILNGGIVLNFQDESKEVLVTLSRNIKSTGQQNYYLAATHKGVVLFHREISIDGISQAVKLSKRLFPRGITKLTLFDTNMNIVAERLVFIDVFNTESVEIKTGKEKYSTREEVRLEFSPSLAEGDSMESTLSVAVVDEGYLGEGGPNQTIESYLLVDSELKGAIEAPASYFYDSDSITSQGKLDLLMMVQGWRSYYWDEIAALAPPDLKGWADAGLSYSGYVKRLFRNQPVVGGEVVLGPFLPSFGYEKTKTDSLGRFKFERLYLGGPSEVVINAINEKGRKSTQIIPDPLPKYEVLVAVDPINKTLGKIGIPQKYSLNTAKKQAATKKVNFEKGSILLGEVSITAPKWNRNEKIYDLKSPLRKPERSFKLTEDDYSFSNIYQYLQHLREELKNFQIDGLRMSYFLDGDNKFIDQLRYVNLKDVYKVDFFKGSFYWTAAMEEPVDIEAAFAIYTKWIWDGYKPERWGRVVLRVNGFHQPHEFYSPKYPLIETGSGKPDHRATLFWSPSVVSNNGKANLEFFTCDNLGSYVAIVECISKNGKIISGAKRFSVSEFNPSLKK